MATAHSYEELDAWQLSAALRDKVLEVSATWQARDRRFCEQLRDAACSAPRNLAEGFALFKPRRFANHARIARGSLVEVKNHLNDAQTRQWLTQDEATSLLQLCRRAINATTGLLKYLDSCKGIAPTGWNADPEP